MYLNILCIIYLSWGVYFQELSPPGKQGKFKHQVFHTCEKNDIEEYIHPSV